MPAAKTFIGKPCKKCGGNVRFNRSHKCVNCQRFYHKQWYQNKQKEDALDDFKTKMKGVDYAKGYHGLERIGQTT